MKRAGLLADLIPLILLLLARRVKRRLIFFLSRTPTPSLSVYFARCYYNFFDFWDAFGASLAYCL
jgi:hypothetical protein